MSFSNGVQSVDDIVRRGVDEGNVWQMKPGCVFIQDYDRERHVIRDTASVSPFSLLPSYTTDGVSRATMSYPSW